MTEAFPIYIGWDAREPVAYEVAAYSIRRQAKVPVDIKPLKHRDLRKCGYFRRPWLVDSQTGEWRDLVDNRPFSTEFSHTRFLVPELQGYKGWALFMDCDMIVRADIQKLIDLCDDKYAVMVVKHRHKPTEQRKMDDQPQAAYHRKNWSSFILFNCAHPSNKKLTAAMVNVVAGSELHGFAWLQDHEIGTLKHTWNWIEGISPVVTGEPPKVIHYTLGGPWFPNCQDVMYAELWTQEYERWQRDSAGHITDVPSARYD